MFGSFSVGVRPGPKGGGLKSRFLKVNLSFKSIYSLRCGQFCIIYESWILFKILDPYHTFLKQKSLLSLKHDFLMIWVNVLLSKDLDPVFSGSRSGWLKSPGSATLLGDFSLIHPFPFRINAFFLSRCFNAPCGC